MWPHVTVEQHFGSAGLNARSRTIQVCYVCMKRAHMSLKPGMFEKTPLEKLTKLPPLKSKLPWHAAASQEGLRISMPADS
jgi:hypothetical protein